MSKYKPLDAPITRREACTIIDRKRFDGAVRSGDIVALGKLGKSGTFHHHHKNSVVPEEDGAQTAPLMFSQPEVRTYAKAVGDELAIESRGHRSAAKDIAKRKPPLTRRQIATHLGRKQTGILVRAGIIASYGALTDTQTAAHTYDPADVAKAINGLADLRLAESRLLLAASKVRVPA